jgi:(2R)-3-sulfolactate dehydrogenase (NADP+)
MSGKTLTIDGLTDLVAAILVNNNTSEETARQVSRALVAAEVEGQKGHGLSRVASYAAQAKSGKVDGHATPCVEKVGEAALRIDAGHGFAFPAFELAVEELSKRTPKTGIAAAVVTNSHHCGVLGYHVKHLAQKGMVALVFSNSPKAIAPWGGKDAVFGTNPIAFAAPRKDQDPLVIDLSLSKVARGKIKLAFEENQPIPEGWALDADGNSTTDAEAAMSGTMVPLGGAKGAALVLMVEILSAALSASHFGFEASSFFTAEGPSPDIGQMIITIAPGPFSENRFYDRMETLICAILDQPGTRLPGSGKQGFWSTAQKEGIKVSDAMYDQLIKLRG